MKKRYIRRIWNDLLNLFYPNQCLLCERMLIDGEQHICSRCLSRLNYTRFPCQSLNPVEHLLIDREGLYHASAFLHFEQGSDVQRLIHQLKYYDRKELGYYLGRLAASELKRTGSPLCRAELLIPVPLHPAKQRKRGYNQSEWIARGMASVLRIPVCTTAIRREKATESQTQRTGFNRWENVKEIFSVTDEKQIEEKHILLVDDVITSGSTAGACLDAFSLANSLQMSFFTLSIASQ